MQFSHHKPLYVIEHLQLQSWHFYILAVCSNNELIIQTGDSFIGELKLDGQEVWTSSKEIFKLWSVSYVAFKWSINKKNIYK